MLHTNTMCGSGKMALAAPRQGARRGGRSHRPAVKRLLAAVPAGGSAARGFCWSRMLLRLCHVFAAAAHVPLRLQPTVVLIANLATIELHVLRSSYTEATVSMIWFLLVKLKQLPLPPL